MSLRICQCGTPYAAELVKCPHCESSKYREEDVVPKITKAGGPSTESALPESGPIDLGREPTLPLADDNLAGVTEDSDGGVTIDNYDSRSWTELQAECKDRGLPATGTKDVLIERLRAGDRKPAG